MNTVQEIMSSVVLLTGICIFIYVLLKVIYSVLKMRIVVPTNEVHITQSKRGTKSYGRNLAAGNVYYRFPSWIPIVGINFIMLPTSIFDVELRAYDAYDQGRLPFTVDVKAFFKIDNAEDAAQRVENFEELANQLRDILKGSVRSILARFEIEIILSDRSRFGDEFTKEVSEQLAAWGVNTVKNIEFMDIRDADGSHVIDNIMSKTKSLIEMESRQKVAANLKNAEIAEISATREATIKQQEADREIGEKNAEKERLIGIATEQAQQEIKEAAKLTAEKEMAIQKVNEERQAEIEKSVMMIGAEANVRVAEKGKDEMKFRAEADLIKEQKRANGIKIIGEAEAETSKLKELAPVQAQIELAKEIGENQGYQNYLINLERVQADKEIGIEKAKALAKSDLKIIVTSSSITTGMSSLMDIFGADGGSKLGSIFEGFKNTPIGENILNKVGLTVDEKMSGPEQKKM